MARKFSQVVSAIGKELSPELCDKLGRDMFFWAPEICWEKLTYWVNDYVDPDSSSSKSVKIYSILCDCSEDEMRRRFQEKGF